MRPKLARTVLKTGPMFAGKTFDAHQTLNSLAFRGYKVLMIENPYNTRNSIRDICSLPDKLYDFVTLKLDDLFLEQLKQYDIIAFEEIHLYFLDKTLYKDGMENQFKKALLIAREYCKKVFLYSLILDSNNNNELFSIIKDIMLLCDQIEVLPSTQACAYCGTQNDVIFCEKNADTEERIGDHYNVVCYNCMELKKTN